MNAFAAPGALDAEARVAAAAHAIREWLTADALAELLLMFDLQAASFDVSPSVMTFLAASHESWMGGEQLDRRLAASVGEGSPYADLVLRVLTTEQAADFVWNFRRGLPRAVIHTLHTLLFPGGERDVASLPYLADARRWSDTHECEELIANYFGRPFAVEIARAHGEPSLFRPVLEALMRDQSSAAPQQAVDDLLEEVSAYPSLVTRRYQERWQAAAVAFPDDIVRRAREASTALGLVRETRPQTGTYDHMVVLGGGGRSPLIRARYAAETIRNGTTVGHIWMLGSPRPIDEANERALVTDYAPNAADEFDLMRAGAEDAFHITFDAPRLLCGCDSTTVGCRAWADRMHDYPESQLHSTPTELQHTRATDKVAPGFGTVSVISASTSDPSRRPNTADTYLLFSELAALKPGQRILIVTTQVFAPFQFFDAVRMLQLPFGVDIEVIGFGAHRGDRPETAEFLLQEILSGLRSARRLITAALAS